MLVRKNLGESSTLICQDFVPFVFFIGGGSLAEYKMQAINISECFIETPILASLVFDLATVEVRHLCVCYLLKVVDTEVCFKAQSFLEIVDPLYR